MLRLWPQLIHTPGLGTFNYSSDTHALDIILTIIVVVDDIKKKGELMTDRRAAVRKANEVIDVCFLRRRTLFGPKPDLSETYQ
jgi:hypothetical protein